MKTRFMKIILYISLLTALAGCLTVRATNEASKGVIDSAPVPVPMEKTPEEDRIDVSVPIYKF